MNRALKAAWGSLAVAGVAFALKLAAWWVTALRRVTVRLAALRLVIWRSHGRHPRGRAQVYPPRAGRQPLGRDGEAVRVLRGGGQDLRLGLGEWLHRRGLSRSGTRPARCYRPEPRREDPVGAACAA